VQDHVRSLAEYLQKRQEGQSLVNRMFALWASTEIPGVMKPEQQKALIQEVLSKQQEDGGWSTTSITISTWKRRDGTPLETKSDGYGTGLVSYILQRAGVSGSRTEMQKALGWLARNQDKSAGLWSATSMNKQRDPESDAGRFMSDAATAYSVLALTNGASR
jgi:squalene-hopene/tetraprenyl-beta-curcumene cyclase